MLQARIWSAMREHTMSYTASRRRRPAMVVSSPGTAKMTSWPARRIEISTMAGCQAYGRLISPVLRTQGQLQQGHVAPVAGYTIRLDTCRQTFG